MKSYQQINPGVTLTHKGDITIEGDIGEGAELHVIDGLVKIKGDVAKNAKITLKVKIGKTIHCNGMVMNSGNKSVYLPLPGSKYVTVIINDKRYTGEKIETLGDDIYINGEKINSSASNADASNNSSPAQIIISGSIMDNVTIISDADVEIETHVGAYCTIKSKNGGFTAKRINNNTSIETRNAINVGRIGSYCNITSLQYGLTAGDIAESVNISVRDQINVGDIGENSIVKSTNYGLKADNVADNVIISVRDSVNVDSVGNFSCITSSNYGIKVDREIGNDVELKARDEITVGDVGNNSSITSSNYGVSVKNLGQNVTINARDDIKVSGECPDNARFNSSNGDVHKTHMPSRRY